MHRTRQQAPKLWPIPRKGTKYVARASSHLDSSVPVLFAVRNMLGIARTAKEVNEMIKMKLIKLNGRIVSDYHQSVQLFHILEAEKSYQLNLLPTGKFAFREVSSNVRLCKVISRTLVGGGKIQLNLHDGTNILSKDKIKVGDSVYVDFENKIKKHLSLEKGRKVLVFSGKYQGREGTIEAVRDKDVSVRMGDTTSNLREKQVVVL